MPNPRVNRIIKIKKIIREFGGKFFINNRKKTVEKRFGEAVEIIELGDRKKKK